MPENTRQPLSQRRGLNRRGTSYEKSEVSARPTDPFVQPGGVSENTKALMGALDKSGNLLTQYTKMKHQEREADKKVGYEAGLTGGPAPGDEASDAKIAGWKQAQGEGAAFDYELEVTEYLQNNVNASPDEFQQGLAQLTQKYTDAASESYLKGFIPQAEKIEQRVTKTYLNEQHEQVLSEGLNNLAKGFRQELSDIVEGKDPEKKAGEVRKLFTKYQQKGKSFGLSRGRVSERMLNLVGREAEKAGDSDLLEFASVPDEDGGIRLTDTKLGEAVRTWKQRAVTAHDTLQKAKAAQVDISREQEKQEVESRIVRTMQGGGEPDIGTLMQLRQDVLEKPHMLVDSDIQAHLENINAHIERQGFSEQSNPALVNSVRTEITNMEKPGDFRTLSKALAQPEVRGQLSRNDYQSLFKSMLQEREAIESQDTQEFKAYHNQSWQYLQSTLKQGSGGQFQFGQKEEIQQQDDARVQRAHDLLNQQVSRFRQEHGRPPNYEEYWKMQDRVKTQAFEAFPKVESQFGMGSSSSSVGNNGGGGGSASEGGGTSTNQKSRRPDNDILNRLDSMQ